MPRSAGRDLTVGVVAAFALAVMAALLLLVGGESRLFSQRISYRVTFANTVGLVVGSPVLISGVRVGSVSEIRLPTDPAESGIQIRVGVEQRYAERVRADSHAALRILQVLSGEKYVEITAGSPESPPLPEDSLIPPLEEGGLIEQGEDIAENLNAITLSLKNILEPLERGQGLLGEMIQDPEFGREGLERLKATVSNLEALTDQIRAGRGFVGRALYDAEFSARIDSLSAAMEDLGGLAHCMSPDQGSLCELLAKDGLFEQAVAELRDAAASLRATAERLERPEGLVGRLLNDREYSEKAATDLDRILGNLAEISDKINSGQGTLGALINERTIHEGMEDVIAGVNDSKFARWLLRHYQKKGIKASERP